MTSEVAKVVIVDNGSNAADRQSLESLSERLGPRACLLLSEVNGGFGYGMNLGIELALDLGAELVLLLNNDTLVEPNAVASLAATVTEQADVGIAVPVVTMGEAPGRVWAAGGMFDERTFRVRHNWTGLPVRRARAIDEPPKALTFAPGAALMVRRELLREVGGFVEGFFLYFEDVEFSVRTRRAGFRIVLAPGAFVWHAVQGGSRRRSTASLYYRVRNALWLARRSLPKWRRPRAFYVIGATAAKAALRKSGGHPAPLAEGLLHILRGLRDGLFRTPSKADLSPRSFI